MKSILEAEDIQGEALRYFKEAYSEAAYWVFPWLPAEISARLLSGYTPEMVKQWLEVDHMLKLGNV